MKKLIVLTLAVSLSLAQVMRAENDNEKKRHKHQAEPDVSQNRSSEGTPAQSSARRPIVRPAAQPQSRSVTAQRTVAHPPHTVAPSQRQPVPNGGQLEGRNPRIQPSSQDVTQNRNVNRNRGDRNFNRDSFNVACSRVIRTPHNRNWWRNRYNTTFLLFGGGYYYCWDNYWYPAYGYRANITATSIASRYTDITIWRPAR